MYKAVRLIDEARYNDEMKKVKEALESFCMRGTFVSADGKELSYVFYTVPSPKASVVIVHGLSEFAEKYTELSWYLHNAGYNVFSYDQRGHGHSYRAVPNLELTHIDDFSQYTEDLYEFVQQVVIPNAQGTRLYSISHSMGGSVMLSFLAAHPEVFSKAVLASPMMDIAPRFVPQWLLRAYISRRCKKYGGLADSGCTKPFTDIPSFKLSADLSYARFSYNLNMRINDDAYKNSVVTNMWIHKALKLKKELYGKCESICADVLIFTAGKDTVVRRRPHYGAARRIPGSRIIEIHNGKHALFCADNEILAQVMKEILTFFTQTKGENRADGSNNTGL